MITVTVRDDGPLLLEGDDVVVCDATGSAFTPNRRPIALCRCGGSAIKPFCDGTHKRIGFEAAERSPD